MTGLTCETDDYGVTARFLPGTPSAHNATLEVKIAPHHAPGVLKTQVTVRTRSGQRLVIPVVAVVP